MATSKGSFDLGDWLVEPGLNRISRNGQSVVPQPKVMDVLACLAAHAGDVVPKQDVIDIVGAAYDANAYLAPQTRPLPGKTEG